MFKEVKSELFEKYIIKALREISSRDILLLSGISLLGYALYIFKPWLSFTVCGLIVLIGGFIMKEN